MEKDKKAILIKYGICFGVAAGIMFMVFTIKGFFSTDARGNILILIDATFVAGAMLTMFAGLLFISGEGGFLGIGFVLNRVVKSFLPMGRKDTETYAQYRERKVGKVKKNGNKCILFTGLFFLLLSVIFMIIWYNM